MSKKGIDRKGEIWYTNEAVASGGTERGGEADLENDTEKRERAQQRGREIRRYLGARKLSERKEVRIQRENCEAERTEVFGETEGREAEQWKD